MDQILLHLKVAVLAVVEPVLLSLDQIMQVVVITRLWLQSWPIQQLPQILLIMLLKPLVTLQMDNQLAVLELIQPQQIL